MKREINLSPEQVKAILLQAKEVSLRDHLLLKTMTVGDFRVGEVVGSAARVWVPFCSGCDIGFLFHPSFPFVNFSSRICGMME